jgi:hypothetical protein
MARADIFLQNNAGNSELYIICMWHSLVGIGEIFWHLEELKECKKGEIV